MLFYFVLQAWIPVFLIISIVTLLRYYIYMRWQVLEQLGIPHDPPTLSDFGHLRTFYDNNQTVFNQDLIRKQKFGKVYGFYIGLQPRIVIHDPAILKQIYIKNFSCFRDRQRHFNKVNGKVMNTALTAVCGNHWKRIRRTMSPFFSAINLKETIGMIEECADRFVCSLESGKSHEGRFKAKEVFGEFSIDVICSAAFNVNIHDQYKSGGSKDIEMAKKIFDISLLQSPVFRLCLLHPWIQIIAEKLNYSLYASGTIEHFSKLAEKIRKDHCQNEKKGIMKLMLTTEITETDIRKGSTKGMTSREITSNAILMIVGGYETTANALIFLSYNLATHKDIQEQVYKEISDVTDRAGGITYESLNRMKYLTMCINESLRLYSTAPRNSRYCERSIEINGITIPEGTHVEIPVYGLSHDEEYWDEPFEYRPERMVDMSKIDPMIFQPFGAGPRNCIGMRFAMIEIKMAICKLLKEYTLDVCHDTPLPPLAMTYTASMRPERDIFLKVIRRK